MSTLEFIPADNPISITATPKGFTAGQLVTVTEKTSRLLGQRGPITLVGRKYLHIQLDAMVHRMLIQDVI